MRCVVLREPYSFEMCSLEVPSPGPGEALVRVCRIGICGTDLHAYRGNQPYFTYPRVLGHELAVEVVALGDGAADVNPGDVCVVMPYLSCGSCIACRVGRTNCCTSLEVLGVHADGGMKEFMTLPVDTLIPGRGLTLDQLALVENQSIGAHAVRRAQVRPGEHVLIIGVGPIGLGVVQAAQAAGAHVIAMDMSERALAFCRETLGVEHLVDARVDPHKQLDAITAGEFPSVLFDATGSPQSMMKAFDFVAHGGRLVFVSIVKSDITFHDPDFHRRELTLLSSRNATREDFTHVMQAMAQGTLLTEPLITHRVALDGLVDAFDDWLKPESGVVKAMVAC